MSSVRAPFPPFSILLGVVATFTGCSNKTVKPVEPPPPLVEVATPVARPVVDYQIFTARTQAVQSVDIKARVTGYLTEILFTDGQEVEANKTFLFKIDDRPYKAALKQAKAALEFSKAALIKAQADYDIGLNVQKNNKGAISEQEITRRLGARDEATASVDQATAALENAQLNFDWCTIKAPISGRANTHFVDIGSLVTQNTTTLTNIVSLKPTWAYFDVDQNTFEKYREDVKKGLANRIDDNEHPAKVEMGLANDKLFPFAGHINFVSNQLDPNTGSIRVRATFDLKLAAGLFVRVKVPVRKEHPALLVADSAIGTEQANKFILVVNERNEVESRFVEVGQQQGTLREVYRNFTVTEPGPDGLDVAKQVEVLRPTDRIIVNGLQRVRPGSKVETRTVNMLTMLPETPTSPPTKKK